MLTRNRCRSKKIRCDGVRPSCTQCVNVGFECKTSDKLSRRAFPRGYTESLEERVRCLEAEVRELKDLLDEKDEKIDMLSRIHSHSPQSINTPRRPSAVSLIPVPEQREEQVDKDDVFKVQQPSLLLGDEESNACFMGASSGRNMIGISAVPASFHVADIPRFLQAPATRGRKVLRGHRFRSVSRHRTSRFMSQSGHIIPITSTHSVRPDDQHLFPGVGTTLPGSAPSGYSSTIRRVHRRSRIGPGQEVYRTAESCFWDCCALKRCMAFIELGVLTRLY